MKITKDILAEKLNIHNPHNLTTETGGALYINYVSAFTGRAPESARWSVVGIRFKTDPDGFWRYNGNKTFSVYSREDKEPKRLEALQWATERYGITEWEKSPFGSYHPAGTMAKLSDLLAAEGKTK